MLFAFQQLDRAGSVGKAILPSHDPGTEELPAKQNCGDPSSSTSENESIRLFFTKQFETIDMTFKDGIDIVKQNLVNLSKRLDNIEKNTQDRLDEIEAASHNRYDLIESQLLGNKGPALPNLTSPKECAQSPTSEPYPIPKVEHHASKKIKIVDKHPFHPIILFFFFFKSFLCMQHEAMTRMITEGVFLKE
ncbi:hypothetical protein K3495_g2291 [Podosphaera aphanis]|nr:hypothetical protein K3495_g2291 [Podosphaera aphanis]